MKRSYTFPAKDMLALCALAGFLVCYAGVVLLLVRQWRSNEIYSHGFLIPFISVYLLYLQREKIERVALKPDYVGGLPPLVAALLCLFVGRIAGIAVLEEVSIVLAVAGVIVVLFGRKLLRAVWFPVFYLLLMIPMWDIFTERAQLTFQLLSATIGVEMLNLLHIPIHQNGIYIEMPNVTLEVAQACSGLNYLVSVMAIGIPLFYIYIRGWVKRGLVLLFSAAVAIASNGFRVFLIGLFVYGGVFGSDGDIHGPLHVLQALFVSVIGYMVIFVAVWAMKDRDPARIPRREDGRVALRRRLWDHVGVAPLGCIAVLIAAFVAFVNFYKVSPAPPRQNLALFPYRVASWEGRDIDPEVKLFRLNGVDQEISRSYDSGAAYPVNLYVGYFESQRQGKELVNFQSDYLFSNPASIDVEVGPAERVRVGRYLETEKGKSTLRMYWVRVDGSTVLDKYYEKIHTVRNALANRRTNSAVVMVSVDIPRGGALDDARSAGEDFIRQIYPILPRYIP